MRFVLAIVLFLGAIASAGLGVAQRTILAGPDSLQLTASAASSARVAVIPGSTLAALPGNQSVIVQGSGTVFAAYGRSADVSAWIGGAEHTSFRVKSGKLVATTVAGSTGRLPTPRDSDLWLDQRSANKELSWPLQLSSDYSLIIASDGTKAAPSTVSIRWPLDNSAPYSGLLLIIGIVLLILGLLAFVWALVHARRRRGPRRRQPRLPRPPRPRVITGPTRRAITSGPIRGRRRGFIAVPVLVLGALVLSGCTGGDLGPLLGKPTSTPTPSASASAAPATPPVAVTRSQLQLILGRIGGAVSSADTTLDATLAATRLTGPALAERTANYAIRKADGSQAAERAIGTGKIAVMLPQQNAKWPRTVFVVAADAKDAKAAPTAMLLVQQSPRAEYKAEYVMSLEPDVTFPDLAPADVGALLVPPDSKYLSVVPDKVGSDYWELLNKGDSSETAKEFDTKGDQLLTELGPDARAQRISSLPASAQLVYSQKPGSGDTIVFSTNDTGAIVAASVDDIETVTPKEAGSAVNPTGQVKLLSGVSQTTKGVVSTYGLQLLFYIPPATDDSGRVRLLGYASGLISATEVP